jgi:signal transduction histidine kinase
MVAETLDFIRDDAVQEPTARLSLTGLLDDLARRYRTLGQPVSWQAGPEVFCRCRPLALKRALTNLIDNALQHGGDAVISLERTAAGEISLEILDHGPGIDPARLEQVFEPFVQLSAEKSARGLGLGLAIARACVQAHGGELILENRPPAGLCAVLRLPVEGR